MRYALKIIGSRLLATVFFLVLLCSGLSAQKETIRVVYYPPWNVSKLPLYLAHEAGIFEKNGLKVSLKNAGSNDNLLKAMKNREGDIYVISSNHVVQSKATGGDSLVIVANMGYLYFLFLADPSITKAEDLKGKKVGTGDLGQTPDQLTRIVLRKLGLDPEKDVTRIHYGGGGSMSRARGLISGEVSAAVISSDAIFELEKSGEIEKWRTLGNPKTLNIYAGDGADYAISASFLKESRDKVKIFIKSIYEGMALAQKDKVAAAEIFKRSRQTTDPLFLDFLYRLYQETVPQRPYPRMESVELMIQMMGSTEPNVRGIKAQDLVDPSLVRELEAEGFLR